MNEILLHSQHTLNQFFERDLSWPSVEVPELSPAQQENFERLNMEWHLIPSAAVAPLDDAYFERLYPLRARDFARATSHKADYREVLRAGHARQQGRLVAVETTPKPNYLPGNIQHYGTHHGFEASAEPLASYMGGQHLHSGTRFNHNFSSLYNFFVKVNTEWMENGLMPAGYRLTICPPALWNLLGTVFYPQWSATAPLELSFYRDAQGNARCYAVGSNQPGDYSYIRSLETGADWSLLGFRTVLMPLDSAI